MKGAVDNLLLLVQAMQEGRPAPAAVAEWVIRGVGAHLERGIALETSLGLGGGSAGRRRARTRWQQSARNAHLRRAHSLREGATPWMRSVALEREITRFLGILWPHWRDLDAPPDGASKLRRCLWHARRLGNLPGTARALHAICRVSR